MIAIYPIRQTDQCNRDLNRLKLSLASMRRFAPSITEFVLADSCSDEPYASQLVQLAQEEKVTLLRCTDPHRWNKSNIFNSAVRSLPYLLAPFEAPEYLVMIDLDMVFLSSGANSVLQHTTGFVTFDIYNLTATPPFTLTESEEDLRLWTVANSYSRNGGRSCGGFQAFPWSWFHRVGGMNQNYVGWGLEDTEFARCAEESGLQHIRSTVPIYHIPHASSREAYDPSHTQWRQNALLYRRHAPRPPTWGQLHMVRIS